MAAVRSSHPRDATPDRVAIVDLDPAHRTTSGRAERRSDMSDGRPLPGKFVWFEHVSTDAKRAQAFYREVLGWRIEPFPMRSVAYEMIYAGDTMISGYAAPRTDGQSSHWIAYVSVEDVDAAAKAALANGGKVVEAPPEIPGVGRSARIADPQGAEELAPYREERVTRRRARAPADAGGVERAEAQGIAS